jgi:hypothetical protein
MFMYIVGYEEVFKIVSEGPFANPTNFIVMILLPLHFILYLHGSESRFVHWFVLTEDFREF